MHTFVLIKKLFDQFIAFITIFLNIKKINVPPIFFYIYYRSVGLRRLRTTALGDAELISCKSHFFLRFWKLLENTLHIYILLYKTIAVALLEY